MHNDLMIPEILQLKVAAKTLAIGFRIKRLSHSGEQRALESQT